MMHGDIFSCRAIRCILFFVYSVISIAVIYAIYENLLLMLPIGTL